MVGGNWNSQHAGDELARLVASGVLGFFTHFEATEVFAVLSGQNTPVNVFSIYVAEERLIEGSTEFTYLNPKPIRLKSLDGWFFGIKRYLKPVAELAPLFHGLSTADEWRPAGQPLQIGKLAPVPTQFIPPDSAANVPLNHVLKNNFWNGAHVLEWADPEKTALQPLFDDSPRLQELSKAVRAFAPLGLASLSDRLGNIVVQLPVTVLIAKFGQQPASGDMVVTIGWYPKAARRPLRASCELNYDGAISAYMSANAVAPQTPLPMADGRGLHHGAVWDDEHRILLAATGDMGFISAVGMTLRVMDPEPRVFNVRDENGVEQQVRVGLTNRPIKNLVGKPAPSPGGEWTNRRMYREETDRLLAELRFVQYKPKQGEQRTKHEEALRHIRHLINQYGEEGAWLWDPYLSADDILKTLFHCTFSGSDLRALTAGHAAPSERPAAAAPPSRVAQLCSWASKLFGTHKAPPPRLSFAEEQRTTIEGAKSNLRGLRLEYRINKGPAGWDFHDRFLIFPATDRGALAWSLGTSIDGLGKQHHILQQVGDGQRISDAFLDLWNALDQPENLVWKS
jgi:hypothetical protein